MLLTPEFSNHITEYRGQVGHETDQIELTLRAAHPFATIEINGERIGKEQEPISIPLNDELQTIEIVVTAENGTKKTYTIMIEREQAEENDSELPAGPILPLVFNIWKHLIITLIRHDDSSLLLVLIRDQQAAMAPNHSVPK